MKNLNEKTKITFASLKKMLKESNEDRKRYRDEVMNDLIDFIKEMASEKDWITAQDIIDNRDEIYDEAFVSDDVTGNGTGSYTKSAYMAENNLVHCWDLLRDAMDTFGDDRNVLDLGPEVCDTIIRCYLLSEVMDKAIEFVVKDMPE